MLDSAQVSYCLSHYQVFLTLGLAASFCTLVQNDHSSLAGCRPPTGYCNNHGCVFSPAVPECFPADSYKVHRPWKESKLPFSSNCWNLRKSAKAFHYSQQVSAPRYINTSNKEWFQLPQYTSWSLLAGSDQEQRQPQPMTGTEISLNTECQPQKQIGLIMENSKQNIQFWESWNWAYEKETRSLRMFSKWRSQW